MKNHTTSELADIMREENKCVATRGFSSLILHSYDEMIEGRGVW